MILEPHAPSTLEAAGATVDITRAMLGVESIEVLGGEATTMHSHDDSGHGHGGETEAPAAGRLEVHTAPAVVDLLGGAVTIGEDPTAAAGTYTQLFVSVGPAEMGPIADTTLLLEGTAAAGGELRSFVVRWNEGADDVAMFETDIELHEGDQRQVNVTLDVGQLFSGVDFFTAEAEGDLVTIDETTHAGLLRQVRTNLGGAFGLEADGELEHGND